MMSNSHLPTVLGLVTAKPPAPAEFKPGDIVRITRVDADGAGFFFVGDLARLVCNLSPSAWVADFSGMGNPIVVHDGRWLVSNSETGAYDFELEAHNG